MTNKSAARRLAEEDVRELLDCPAMWVTHYSGNADRGEHIKHVQCICCATDKGKPHLDECHIGKVEANLGSWASGHKALGLDSKETEQGSAGPYPQSINPQEKK